MIHKQGETVETAAINSFQAWTPKKPFQKEGISLF